MGFFQKKGMSMLLPEEILTREQQENRLYDELRRLKTALRITTGLIKQDVRRIEYEIDKLRGKVE